MFRHGHRPLRPWLEKRDGAIGGWVGPRRPPTSDRCRCGLSWRALVGVAERRRVRRRRDDGDRRARVPHRSPRRRLLVRGPPGGLSRARRSRDDHAHARAHRRRRPRRRLGRRRRRRARERAAETPGSRPASRRCAAWERCSTRRSCARAAAPSSSWSTSAWRRSPVPHRRPRGRRPARLVAGLGRRRARHGADRDAAARRAAGRRSRPPRAGTPGRPRATSSASASTTSPCPAEAGSWRPFVSGHRFLDGTHTLRELTGSTVQAATFVAASAE